MSKPWVCHILNQVLNIIYIPSHQPEIVQSDAHCFLNKKKSMAVAARTSQKVYFAD